MNRSTLTTLLVLLIITALAQSVVIVRDTEKAILLKLGAYERTLDSGLNFKVPFIDNVIKFEGRLRSLDTPPDRVLSSESKPLSVDAFVKYKIVDAETYYTATNGGQTRVAEDTLQRRVKDKIRNEFGKRSLQDVVSGDRDGLMEALKNSLDEDAGELGVQIVDLHKRLKANDDVFYYRKLNKERDDQFIDLYNKAYAIVKDKPYDINPTDWCKAEFDLKKGNVQKTNTYFCSALVSFLLVALSLLPKETDWTIMRPKDLGTENGTRLDLSMYEKEVEFSL